MSTAPQEYINECPTNEKKEIPFQDLVYIDVSELVKEPQSITLPGKMSLKELLSYVVSKQAGACNAQNVVDLETAIRTQLFLSLIHI